MTEANWSAMVVGRFMSWLLRETDAGDWDRRVHDEVRAALDGVLAEMWAQKREHESSWVVVNDGHLVQPWPPVWVGWEEKKA